MDQATLKTLREVKYRTPINLTPRKRGKWKLEQDVVSGAITLVSMRTSIFTGLPKLCVNLESPLQVHRLKYNKNVIASDIPEEMYTQGVSFQKAHGCVLVGGLGLGMAAVMIARMPDVERVIVVESEQDVIDMVWDQLPRTRMPIEIVKADLFEYLKDCPKFDFAYFDIWSPTGEGAWDDYIVPLRRLVWKHHGRKSVGCWLEAEMQGQLRSSFATMLDPLPGINVTHWIDSFRPLWVLKQAIKNTVDPREIKRLINLYFNKIGSPLWERTFPWDKFKERVAA